MSIKHTNSDDAAFEAAVNALLDACDCGISGDGALAFATLRLTSKGVPVTLADEAVAHAAAWIAQMTNP